MKRWIKRRPFRIHNVRSCEIKSNPCNLNRERKNRKRTLYVVCSSCSLRRNQIVTNDLRGSSRKTKKKVTRAALRHARRLLDSRDRVSPVPRDLTAPASGFTCRRGLSATRSSSSRILGIIGFAQPRNLGSPACSRGANGGMNFSVSGTLMK